MTDHKPIVRGVSCMDCRWVNYARLGAIDGRHYCTKTRHVVSLMTICDEFEGMRSPESMNFRMLNCCFNCKHSKIEVGTFGWSTKCDIDGTNITCMDHYYCADWEEKE